MRFIKYVIASGEITAVCLCSDEELENQTVAKGQAIMVIDDEIDAESYRVLDGSLVERQA